MPAASYGRYSINFLFEIEIDADLFDDYLNRRFMYA